MLDTKSLVAVGLTLFGLAGCATTIEGAQAPPHGWMPGGYFADCELLSGTYVELGEPAPENAHSWLYNTIWPVAGSLTSIIELGANAAPRDNPSSVIISVSASGEIHVDALDSAGARQTLAPRPWQCESGTLVSRTPLTTDEQSSSAKAYREAYVRLWKAADGSLIAEQTTRAVRPESLRASSRHRPVARFYFRFSPRT